MHFTGKPYLAWKLSKKLGLLIMAYRWCGWAAELKVSTLEQDDWNKDAGNRLHPCDPRRTASEPAPLYTGLCTSVQTPGKTVASGWPRRWGERQHFTMHLFAYFEFLIM